MPTCLETMKQLVCKAGFSKEVADVVTACLYQGKWSRFLHWCHERNGASCKATAQQLEEFFMYL